MTLSSSVSASSPTPSWRTAGFSPVERHRVAGPHRLNRPCVHTPRAPLVLCIRFVCIERKTSLSVFRLTQANLRNTVACAGRHLVSVLVIEDDGALRTLLEAVLGRSHITPHVIGRGDDALRAIAEGAYDAIILDLLLP